ncbi:hypothetical protein FB451DRAFT_1411581 [Mycena latifolia]|nr:hypothetical protein FB451DRAFT_1411581 [Mycena latifolia]
MSTYVVTGAARGLGLEFVNQLSADGNNTVFALVRSKSSASGLTDLARPNVTVLEGDITDTESLKAAASAVAEATGGKLDYLINNAAALEQDLLENFRVNLFGTIHATNAFLPLLRAGTAKKIITLSSCVGDVSFTTALGNPGQVGYSVSKATLNMAVAKFAVALKPEGFVVLAISPGLVNTVTTPLTPQQQKEVAIFREKLAVLAPDFKGPITPRTSVEMMLEVIYRWRVEDTGAFVSHHGNQEWL